MVNEGFDESAIDGELAAALGADQFGLHYQPIRDVADLSLVAYEALIRWPHPVRGMVPPSRFIPVAERSAMIHDLGVWVVGRACRDAEALRARYIGVNVSAVQLQRGDFASRFAAAARDTGVEAARITVEITETVPLQQGRVESRNLQALRDLGCWLAVDDFGAGHASLAYLDRFPFNVLKIDKALVGTLGKARSVFGTIARLCDVALRRNIVVVAEGVETERQLELVRKAGCTRAQGYLLGRPAPLAAWTLEAPGIEGGRAGVAVDARASVSFEADHCGIGVAADSASVRHEAASSGTVEDFR